MVDELRYEQASDPILEEVRGWIIDEERTVKWEDVSHREPSVRKYYGKLANLAISQDVIIRKAVNQHHELVVQAVVPSHKVEETLKLSIRGRAIGGSTAPGS